MQGEINLHIDRHSTEVIKDYINAHSSRASSRASSQSGFNDRSGVELYRAPKWPDQVKGACPIRALLEHYNGVPIKAPRKSGQASADEKLRLHLKLSGPNQQTHSVQTDKDKSKSSPQHSHRSGSVLSASSRAGGPADNASARASPKTSNRTDASQQGRTTPSKLPEPTDHDNGRLSPRTSQRTDNSLQGRITPSRIEPVDHASSLLSSMTSKMSNSGQSAPSSLPGGKSPQNLNPPRDNSSTKSGKTADLEEFTLQIQAMDQQQRNNAIQTEVIEQGDEVFVIYRI